MTVPELTTERLLLRGFRDDDLDAWAAMAADMEVMGRLGHDEPLDRGQAWRLMATYAGHWMLRGYGFWAVQELSSGEFIGRVGLWQPEGWPGLELGWAIARDHWGRGYAPEAARAALDWAWAELGAEHVISLVAPDNRRSATVAERIGETVEGRTRLNGEELLVYGIDRPR